MDEKPIDSDLLLPDLYIENFRGIKKLSIPRLGRVTLLAGRNGVGKTTVLEALKVYAKRVEYNSLHEVLTDREEISVITDEDGDATSEPEWEALFYGRDVRKRGKILLGSRQGQDQLCLESISLSNMVEEDVVMFEGQYPQASLRGESHALKATFQSSTWFVPAFFSLDKRQRSYIVNPRAIFMGRGYLASLRRDPRMPPPVTCEQLGPDTIDSSEMSRYWDKVALEPDEGKAIHALNLIYGDDVERITMIGDDAQSRRIGGRRFMVKLKSLKHRTPLKSLGGGAFRLCGVALALANSHSGFLLIDEAENGIHHSVQQDYWRMVLQTAHENNVQVFATTHSWDCVRGFAQAAVDYQKVDGVLVRLEKEEDGLRAVRYSEEDLKVAADQKIEVR